MTVIKEKEEKIDITSESEDTEISIEIGNLCCPNDFSIDYSSRVF